jgi:hypothetical protein
MRSPPAVMRTRRAFGFNFLGSISNNDTAVGIFLAVFWDIIVKDNFTCFGTFGSFGGVV